MRPVYRCQDNEATCLSQHRDGLRLNDSTSGVVEVAGWVAATAAAREVVKAGDCAHTRTSC